MTDAGWQRLWEALGAIVEVPGPLTGRINTHIAAGLLDSAIRELTIAVETRMRELTGTRLFGQQLVTECIDQLIASQGCSSARGSKTSAPSCAPPRSSACAAVMPTTSSTFPRTEGLATISPLCLSWGLVDTLAGHLVRAVEPPGEAPGAEP
jgi:hypothetical protein